MWVGLQPFAHACGQKDACAQNPNRLELQLPEMTVAGLREGSLGTLSEDEDHLRRWRAILRNFRKRTTAGMWVMNPLTRARVLSKHLRYSLAGKLGDDAKAYQERSVAKAIAEAEGK